MAVNLVVFEGNISQDLDLKDIKDTQLCKTSMAINFYEKGENIAWFVQLEIWGKTALYAKENLQKGSRCLVQGRLKQSNWTDKLGNLKTTFVIVVADISPLIRINDLTNGIHNVSEKFMGPKEITQTAMPMGKTLNRDIDTGQGKIEESFEGINFDNVDLPF